MAGPADRWETAVPDLPPGGAVWFDFAAPTAEERRLLAEGFGFHPMAVEDAVAQVHFPKVDDYGEFLFLAVHEAELAETLARNPALLARGPGFLLHALLDNLVESYLPVLDALEERTEAAEEAIFRRNGRAGRRMVDEILALKRELAGLRRFSVLQREVLREHLPLARWPGGFWTILGGMGVLAAAMVTAFRRAGWL